MYEYIWVIYKWNSLISLSLFFLSSARHYISCDPRHVIFSTKDTSCLMSQDVRSSSLLSELGFKEQKRIVHFLK